MSEPQATEQPSNTHETGRVGAPNLTNTHRVDSDVRPMEAGEETSDTFRAVYTALDEDLEVELVERVPPAKSDHQFGHAVIDRPEWDNTRVALLQNVRVDVHTDDEEAGFDD